MFVQELRIGALVPDAQMTLDMPAGRLTRTHRENLAGQLSYRLIQYVLSTGRTKYETASESPLGHKAFVQTSEYRSIKRYSK